MSIELNTHDRVALFVHTHVQTQGFAWWRSLKMDAFLRLSSQNNEYDAFLYGSPLEALEVDLHLSTITEK
jgi:hypothetical protein